MKTYLDYDLEGRSGTEKTEKPDSNCSIKYIGSMWICSVKLRVLGFNYQTHNPAAAARAGVA